MLPHRVEYESSISEQIKYRLFALFVSNRPASCGWPAYLKEDMAGSFHSWMHVAYGLRVKLRDLSLTRTISEASERLRGELGLLSLRRYTNVQFTYLFSSRRFIANCATVPQIC